MKGIFRAVCAVLASPPVLAAAGALALSLSLQELAKQAVAVTEAVAQAQEQAAQALNGKTPAPQVDVDHRAPVDVAGEREELHP